MRFSQPGLFVQRGVACAAVLFSLIAAPAVAATLEIAFTGMDLVYDGSAIYDGGSNAGGTANPADGDSLTTVDFFVDGSNVGSLTSNISLDVKIPDVTGIPSGAGTVHNISTPGNPGFFDLMIGSPLSEFLLVSLDTVSITYVDVANIVQFNFGAAVSSVFAQNLPFGLLAGEPITVAFSAQVVPGSLTSAGGFVTGFRASGTGQYNAPVIPEPATCLMAACGLVAFAVRRK